MGKNILITVVVLFSILTIFLFARPSITGNTISTLPQDSSSNNINVILVVIDTLRQDHLRSYGYNKETSPNIDKLAKEGILFENAYSTAPWTRSAIASILTSKLPIEHGINSEAKKETLSENFFTIQEFFNNKNYKTAAFYTNPHLNFGLVQEFDYTNFKSNEHADLTYPQAIGWIKDNSQDPFFLLIHNNDPHDAYEFHKGFSTTPKNSEYRLLNLFSLTRQDGNNIGCEQRENNIKLNQSQLNEMKANYDGEIAFTDYQLGKLLDYLKKTELDKKTIVIITADHGEEFLDHNGYWHGCTLYNELIKVPLIIKFPDSDEKQISEKISTIDIFPTLTEFFDKENLQDYDLSGKSLLPLIKNESWISSPIFSSTAFRGPLKYSLIIGDYKLTKYSSGEIVELYNLDKDPDEKENLVNTNLEQVELLNNSLSLILNSKKLNLEESEESNIDKETLEQLRSLGYLT